MRSNRRTFIQWAASILAGWRLQSNAAAAPLAVTVEPTHSQLLQAVGNAVLPGRALGSRGIARVVAEFSAWMRDFRPAVELDHGYGTSEITYTPSSPAARWARQLERLEREARSSEARSFGELSPERQRELLRSELGEMRPDLPAPAEAEHVAVGLLSFFYSSPEATDLCYEARIGADTCRDLESSSERPQPLTPTIDRS
jgi:hypothetical protein